MPMATLASRTLVAIDSSRRQFNVQLEIGTPYRCAENDWACAVAIDGLFQYLWDQHGVDAFQALIVAQTYARTLLTDFVAQGGQLLNVVDGAPLDVDQLFTQG